VSCVGRRDIGGGRAGGLHGTATLGKTDLLCLHISMICAVRPASPTYRGAATAAAAAAAALFVSAASLIVTLV